jgi:hypothetical protein
MGFVGVAPRILTLALHGGDCSLSQTSRFTPEGRDPGAHKIGGRAGPRTRLDTVEKRKISSVAGNRTLISRSSSW